MRKKSKAPTRKPLATLTEEELIEYRNRRNLLINKQMELVSVSNYVDQYENTIKDKYDLPAQFDLTLTTGEVFEREVSGNGSGV